MSEIPPSKRSDSDLKAQHLVYQIRRQITAELLSSFGLSQKKMLKHIARMTDYVKDPEEKAAAGRRIRDMEEDFEVWYIHQERIRVLNLISDISCHMRAANTIWPEGWAEYDERRLEWDRALMCCNKLQDELQYIAETLPTDKNKYTRLVLDIEVLFKMIKSLRQSDNRFKKRFPPRGK